MPDLVLHHGCSHSRPGKGLTSEQVRVGRSFMRHSTVSILDPEAIMTTFQGVHMMFGEALSRQLGPLSALELLRHVGC